MSQSLEVIFLALVQGLTEFLPVSSSAHLILVPLLTGWQDQGLAFDVAVHFGTLLAVCWYFRRDLIFLTQGLFRSIRGKGSHFYSPLAWQLIIATLPVLVIGYAAHDFVSTTLRSPIVIAITTIGFGLLLFASDTLSAKQKRLSQLNLKDVLLIGFAQTLAIIPGTSRSGITLTMGLSLGLSRKASAKFSFLLAIPVILLAAGYEGIKAMHSPLTMSVPYLFLGIGISAISAYFCIRTFLLLVNKVGVIPFVLYRLLLGGFLLFVFL